ncbi:hypothetical protein BANRA_01860 [Escherichia coli]|nr:hypothetical protein BANRA_01860 [Escherichia coli]
MHSDYYNMVLVKNWPIFYMKLTLNFYERNVIEEAVNALFCEREIINNKNIIKKLMFFCQMLITPRKMLFRAHLILSLTLHQVIFEILHKR